jgi:spermidine/putrescine transport system substrate-binding protein
MRKMISQTFVSASAAADAAAAGRLPVKSNMKRSFIRFAVIPLLFFAAGCSGKTSPAAKAAGELNLFTWQEYVPPTVVEKFEKDTGIRINYSYFSTNEEMLAKLQALGGGQYDIILCSDYIIDLAVRNGDLLAKIDTGRLQNYKNIDPRFLGKYFDPENQYTIPYWISTGAIVYDPARTSLAFVSFADLADPSLRDNVAIIEDPRGIISVVLKVLGYGYNETDPEIIFRAKPFLDKFRPNIKAFNTDSPQDLVINGDAIASYQTGAQAVYALIQDSSLKISYPREGGNILNIDSFVIPRGAPHPDNAYTFLDYVLQPEIAALAAQWTHYQNTNLYYEELIKEDIDAGHVAIAPDELIDTAEMYINLGDSQQVYDRLWTEFK